MVPALPSGKVIIATIWFWKLRPGDVVIIDHHEMEKLKRIKDVSDNEIFVTGDNPVASTDSRHFGWLGKNVIKAKVIRRLPMKTV